MEIPGEPRSVAEMEFVAGMHPCAACGDARPGALHVRHAVIGHGDGAWIVGQSCPACGAVRELIFRGPPELAEVTPGTLELGGPEPSRILTPATLRGEIERVALLVAPAPGAVDVLAWYANVAVVDRVRVALRELAKFAGVDHEALAAERARWDAVAADLARDAARIVTGDRGGRRDRGQLHAAAIAAHGAWLARGKAGEGRLDVVVGDAAALAAPGADLAACRLEAVRLGGADLRGARLDDAELVDVDLRGADLAAATLAGARLRGCWLDGAELAAATLDRARLALCVLDRAQLVRTRWRAAVITATSLRGARLGHAQLDGARFVDCDLRDAELGAHAAGAVFDRCDLRGASLAGSDLRGAHLVRCKLAGVHGAPAATDGWSVVFGDFSPAGDGSAVGDGEDLLDELAN